MSDESSELTQSDAAEALAKILKDVSGKSLSEKDKKKWLSQEVEIERTGTKIVLPEGMADETAVTYLTAVIERKNQTFTAVEWFEDHYATEAAVGFYRAMQQRYGAAANAQTQTIQTLFGGKQKRPPQMVSIRTGPDETIEVPFGKFRVPGMDSPIVTQLRGDGVFGVVSELKGREREEFYVLMQLTREFISKHSIYRGTALRFSEDIEPLTGPQFIDLSGVRRHELILPEDVQGQIEQSVYTPITHAQRCREQGIPLDRKVLLTGAFGTGKTLTSRVTASIAQEAGWTFIEVADPKQLRAGLEFARKYQPAVVFCEDIDRITGERDDEANALLNEVDGIVSKGAEILVVMTTNYVERITKAMLRPGRMDAVIHVTLPDDDARERLIRTYAADRLADDVDLTNVVAELDGSLPSTIREVVERAKLGMIGHNRQELTGNDLLFAAKSMLYHTSLLADEQKDEPSREEQLGRSFAAVMANGPLDGVMERLKTLEKKATEIAREVC